MAKCRGKARHAIEFPGDFLEPPALPIEAIPIEGALLVRPEAFADERGTFSTIWDAHAPSWPFVPSSLHFSRNPARGTLRGMHYQRSPHAQQRLVACAAGRIFDVVLDLRPSSRTYLMWHALHLDAESGAAVFVPAGCAHGFVTLEDHSTVTYLIGGAYAPASRGIVRWNDPRFAIAWPVNEPMLSRDDREAPDFVP